MLLLLLSKIQILSGLIVLAGVFLFNTEGPTAFCTVVTLLGVVWLLLEHNFQEYV